MSHLFINGSIFDNQDDELSDFECDLDDNSDDNSYDKENIYDPPLFDYSYSSLNIFPCYTSHTYTFIYHMQTKPYYEKYKQNLRLKQMYSSSNFKSLVKRNSFYEKS
tara:strand:- start:2450 stop:2770 length:321 start_codon:yes stop_codon:yes gene_type:complete